MFGTMCKPLHAGKAAYHGLMAAKLAARGFTSRPDVLECGQGFARTHSPDFNPERAFDTPPNGWWIASNLVQVSCLLLHDPRCDRGGPQAAGTTSASRPTRSNGSTSGWKNRATGSATFAAPVTGLEAKFSLRLTTAMGLAGADTSRLSTYSEAVAADPITGRAARQGLAGFPLRSIPTPSPRSRCRYGTARGFTAQHDAGIPATDVMHQGTRLEAKFAALVDPVLGTDKTARSWSPDVGRLDLVVAHPMSGRF